MDDESRPRRLFDARFDYNPASGSAALQARATILSRLMGGVGMPYIVIVARSDQTTAAERNHPVLHFYRAVQVEVRTVDLQRQLMGQARDMQVLWNMDKPTMHRDAWILKTLKEQDAVLKAAVTEYEKEREELLSAAAADFGQRNSSQRLVSRQWRIFSVRRVAGKARQPSPASEDSDVIQFTGRRAARKAPLPPVVSEENDAVEMFWDSE